MPGDGSPSSSTDGTDAIISAVNAIRRILISFEQNKQRIRLSKELSSREARALDIVCVDQVTLSMDRVQYFAASEAPTLRNTRAKTLKIDDRLGPVRQTT